MSGVECVRWSARPLTTMLPSVWYRQGIWQGSIHDDVTPARSLRRKSQFTTSITTSNQFTLDFVPPFSYTYMALSTNLSGVG